MAWLPNLPADDSDMAEANRMKLEKDELEIMGGVRHGVTLGSPVAVVVRNTEWAEVAGRDVPGSRSS